MISLIKHTTANDFQMQNLSTHYELLDIYIQEHLDRITAWATFIIEGNDDQK